MMIDKVRHQLFLPKPLSDRLEALAARPGASKSAILIDAVTAWLNRRGTNEIVVEANAPVNGQSLIGELPKIVSYVMVTAAIDFGNANGWKRDEAGAPFRCKWVKKAFERVEE